MSRGDTGNGLTGHDTDVEYANGCALKSRLRACSPGAPSTARFGTVSFIQRFGASINSNLHYHCAVIDGVFSECGGALCFHPASALGEADVAVLERVVATRVLRLFERLGV